MIRALRKDRRGFTLIELMTVVIIVGILASVSVPLYRAQVRRAIATEGAALVGSVRTAQRIYFAEHNEYATKAQLEAIGAIETFDNRYFDWANVTITVGGDDNEEFEAVAPGRAGSNAAGISVTIDHLGELSYTGLN